MNTKNYCVIMAGGIGSRFWPESLTNHPKQFIDILGTGKSFIRSTFERFLPIIPVENFLVVTSEMYRDLTMEHLPELSPDQVLCEPLRRNTAPCIAYASFRVKRMCPDANMIVTPADHLVTNEAEFHRIITEGITFVDRSSELLTIGIKPSRPETGYGYIQIDTQDRRAEFCRVKTFTEKPNLDLARAFVQSGEFLWNSGIFVWSVEGILSAIEQYLPDVYSQFSQLAETFTAEAEHDLVEEIYSKCRSISIDYGVMEKADNVFVRSGNFGWSDIGTWGSLYQNVEKDEQRNVVNGKVLTYNTQNSIISLEGERIGVIEGLDGYLVVEKGKALLICSLENEQSIRNYVEDVKRIYGEEYI